MMEAKSSLSDKLNKLENENEKQYLWRIGQLIDSGKFQNWKEVAPFINQQWRESETEYRDESAYRKAYKYAKDFYEDVFIHMTQEDDYINELEKQKQELQKERYKFFDYRNAYNKVLRERSRQEELNEIIVATVNGGYLPRLEYIPTNSIDYCNNTMLISLNDMHIGADIDNAFNKYNTDICRERLCEYIDKIKFIAKMHKSKECVVWCNGDVINGAIHSSLAVTNKENIIEQIVTASELISEFLSELSKLFAKVRFVSVAGNHSRLGSKEDSLKDERLDDLIEWYLRARLQNFDNINFDEFDKIDSTMYLVNVNGLNYLGVHGDYDNSMSKIQALQMMIKKDIYGVLLGHKHHNKTDNIQGIKTIMAGSFLGVDDFCISQRIYGSPEQLVSVVDNNGVICHYDIQFDK